MRVASDEWLDQTLRTWSGSASIEGVLADGYRNRVWAVRVGGRRYAARSSQRDEPALEWEIGLLQYLRAAGMVVPEILPAGDGRMHVHGLTLMSWLEGELPSSGRDWKLVAHQLTRVHDLTRNWSQRPGFRSSGDLLTEHVGGDVRLDLMPAEVVEQVREAWRAVQEGPRSVVHGDPGAGNIRLLGGRPGLFDWDEARVDVSCFDLAALPYSADSSAGQDYLARRAAIAWEVANGWVHEPKYARRRLAELESLTV